MTPRERFIAALNRQETDFIPYVITTDAEVAERLDEYFGNARWREAVGEHVGGVSVTDFNQFEAVDEIRRRDIFGVVWRFDKKPEHLEHPPIPEPDLTGYRFPRVDDFFCDDWLEEGTKQARQVRAEGKFVLHGFTFGLFERSWTLRGFENALVDTALNPGFYEELLDAILELYLEVLDRLVQLPLDGIRLADDWGDQRGVIIGADRWRRFLKPRFQKMVARVKEAGIVAINHCCGSITEIMPDVVECGLDCLESVQPEAMDPYYLKRRFGDRIAFWGAVGTQQLLPRGTPTTIRAEVKKLCAEMGKGGGYVLAPAKPVMPDVPTENAVAFIEAALEQAGRSL